MIRDSFHHAAFVSTLGITSELCFTCRRPPDEPQEGGAEQGEGVLGRDQGRLGDRRSVSDGGGDDGGGGGGGGVAGGRRRGGGGAVAVLFFK